MFEFASSPFDTFPTAYQFHTMEHNQNTSSIFFFCLAMMNYVPRGEPFRHEMYNPEKGRGLRISSSGVYADMEYDEGEKDGCYVFHIGVRFSEDGKDEIVSFNIWRRHRKICERDRRLLYAFGFDDTKESPHRFTIDKWNRMGWCDSYKLI